MARQAKKQLVAVTEGSNVRIRSIALQSSLNAYNEGMADMAKGSWKVAESIHAMLTGKQWEEDFDSERSFCDAIGAKQSTWNQMKTAVTFRNANRKLTEGMTPSHVYILSGVDNPAEMLTWAYKEKISTNSDAKLKEAIKKYKNKDAIDADYSVKEDAEEPEEKETATEAEGLNDDDLVQVVYKKKNYNIPWKVLKKYEVKE